MKRVLIVHFSTAGKTETMANFIAEGIRFSGLQTLVKKVSDVRSSEDIAGYDGYIFGSPTFSLDIPGPVKIFLSKIKATNLENKLVGAFGPYLHDASYQHNSHAPTLILSVLQSEHKMAPFDLGALALKEDIVETREGMKACQEYGRIFGQRLSV
jgi:flavorubredoxin